MIITPKQVLLALQLLKEAADFIVEHSAHPVRGQLVSRLNNLRIAISYQQPDGFIDTTKYGDKDEPEATQVK